MTSEGLSTAYHVVLSLAVVIAVVVVAARLARRAGVKGPGAGLRVLDRAGLSREASVAVVEVDGRRMVVGVTPHGVNLLADLAAPTTPTTPTTASAPSDLTAPAIDLGDRGIQRDQGSRRTPEALPLPRDGADPALVTARAKRPAQASGSVLAPATWKQGVEALRDLTARKG